MHIDKRARDMMRWPERVVVSILGRETRKAVSGLELFLLRL